MNAHCRSRITFAEPQIHALVYEPTTGLANKLKINIQEYIDDLRHVYDLYQVGIFHRIALHSQRNHNKFAIAYW